MKAIYKNMKRIRQISRKHIDGRLVGEVEPFTVHDYRLYLEGWTDEDDSN